MGTSRTNCRSKSGLSGRAGGSLPLWSWPTALAAGVQGAVSVRMGAQVGKKPSTDK